MPGDSSEPDQAAEWADSLTALDVVHLRTAGDAIDEAVSIYRAVRDESGHIVDADILYANAASRTGWGLATEFEPVAGRRLLEVAPHLVASFGDIARVVEANEPFRGEVQDGDRWFDVSIRPFDGGFVSVSRDVTDRLAVARSLRDSVERLRGIVEGVDAIVTERDLATGRWTVSAQAERILGYPIADLVHSETWRALVHPEDIARCEAVWDGGSGHWDVEYRMHTAGGAYIWLRERFRVQSDDDGRPVRWFGLAFDVTEDRRRQDRVMRGQRLESLGRLASAVAHDFQNVLFGIAIMAERLEVELPYGRSRDDALGILRAVNQGTNLTQRLYTLAHGAPSVPLPLDLGLAVQQVMPLVERLIGGGIEIRSEVEPELPQTVVDPDQVEQVLVNLAVNARDAMPDGGRLTIRVSRSVVGATEAAGWGVQPGVHVSLEVADTGIGMTDEVLAHVYEPLFTTKPPSLGTGLGLAVVRGFVQASAGGIVITSTPGQGTTVRILLPEAIV